MREDRNRRFERRKGQRERHEKYATGHRDFQRKQREERVAWMAAYKKNHRRHEFQEGKEWFGIFIILIGLIWLGKAFFGPYPDWLFSWQSLLIAIGFALGLASRFRHKAAFVLIFIGLIFMTRDYIFPDRNLETYIWPIIVIGIGVLFLFKKRKEARLRSYMRKHPEEFEDWRDHWHRECTAFWPGSKEKEEKKYAPDATNPSSDESKDKKEAKQNEVQDNSVQTRLDDWANITNVFGGTRRTLLSKHFKGGEIVNILGGIELDLSRADIAGTITLDITNVMGGISLAIPPNWQLTYNCTCLMSGTDDRRRSANQHDPNKTLILTGTVLMGGIEVRDIL